MHCQRDMDGRKAEGEKIVKERRRVKLFRCAMAERRRWSGQKKKEERLTWETEEPMESRQRGPQR